MTTNQFVMAMFALLAGLMWVAFGTAGVLCYLVVCQAMLWADAVRRAEMEMGR